MSKKSSPKDKIAKKLRQLNGQKTRSQPKASIWEGPEINSPKGGVTQSMLGRFLYCRERFRLKVIEGLRPTPRFNPRLEYGHMWHTAEEVYDLQGMKNAMAAVRDYAEGLAQKYRDQQAEVQKWYNVCCTQFPIYTEYWQDHREPGQPLARELKFSVPFKLPSGRTVYLRGKMDGIDLVLKGADKGVWLREHKTKSAVDEERLSKQLTNDMQVMFYLTALYGLQSNKLSPFNNKPHGDIRGVRYNVVRRPLAGGKHTIRPHKATKGSKKKPGKPAETLPEYYARLGDLIEEDPEHFFARWTATVTESEVKLFQQQVLIPILEQLCDWYAYVNDCYLKGIGPWDDQIINSGIHWVYPYGMFNPTLEGWANELDEYLATGSKLGLVHSDALFEELS